jgi:hypothetical protein
LFLINIRTPEFVRGREKSTDPVTTANFHKLWQEKYGELPAVYSAHGESTRDFLLRLEKEGWVVLIKTVKKVKVVMPTWVT